MAKSKKRAKIPIDVKKLMESMDEVTASREWPVNISTIIDVTASDGLIDAVLEGFAPIKDNVSVQSAVLQEGRIELAMPCDLCVVVGGLSPYLGQVAAEARSLGCPTVVAVDAQETCFAQSASDACEILGDAFDEDDIVGIPEDDVVDVDVLAERPLDALSRWIAVNAPAKRVAMACALPFMRMSLATELSSKTALQNAGVGIVFIMPGADMPVITLNQAKLVLQIAGIYDQPLDQSRIMEIAAVVAGAFGFRALARELSDAVPGLGWGIKGAVAYTGTLAMGKAAVEYFEEGGRINGLAAKIREALDAVVAAAGCAAPQEDDLDPDEARQEDCD